MPDEGGLLRRGSPASCFHRKMNDRTKDPAYASMRDLSLSKDPFLSFRGSKAERCLRQMKRRHVKKICRWHIFSVDLGGYAAVASILVSTAPPRLAHFPVGRAESPAPTNILRGFSVGADNEHSGAKRKQVPLGYPPPFVDPPLSFRTSDRCHWCGNPSGR